MNFDFDLFKFIVRNWINGLLCVDSCLIALCNCPCIEINHSDDSFVTNTSFVCCNIWISELYVKAINIKI